MARLDLRDSTLSDRHLQHERLRRAAVAQGEDWRLPDLPPAPIASPSPATLVVGDRLIEFPNRPSARSGTFVGWGLHRQRGELLPIVAWDSGHQSFSDLRILTLESNMTQTPHEPPSSLEAVRMECHRLIDRLSQKNLGLKLLLNARNMLRLLDGYKSKRNLGDRNSPR